MRYQTEAIRGLRWGAMAVSLALGAIVVVQLVDTTPSAKAAAEVTTDPGATELVAGEGVPRLEVPRLNLDGDAPPQVPPPPPLPGSRPRPPKQARVFVPPQPVQLPEPVPGQPVILGLANATEPVVLAPPETRIAVDWEVPEYQPVRPVIINHAKTEADMPTRDSAALRFVRTVGKVFGIGD